jgi:phosphoribosylanthranilate isomerase
MTRVKVCGVKTLVAARAALRAGADFLGFVFYPPSPRFVTLAEAVAVVRACRAEFGAGWQAVAVFANPSPGEVERVLATGDFDWVQLSGDETPEFCASVPRPVLRGLRVEGDATLEAVRANRYRAARYLLDAHVPGRFGGTGQSYDWARVAPVAGECFLAGGLTPANVGRAIAVARPWGVDVSSGVERDGEKDPELIAAFLAAVRRPAGAPGLRGETPGGVEGHPVLPPGRHGDPVEARG